MSPLPNDIWEDGVRTPKQLVRDWANATDRRGGSLWPNAQALLADAALTYAVIAVGDVLTAADGSSYVVRPAVSARYDNLGAGLLRLACVSQSVGFGTLQAPTYATYTPGIADPQIVGTVGHRLIGSFGSKLYSRAAETDAWAELCNAASASPVVLIEPMSDGEVIAVSNSAIHRSTGWGTPGCTWTSKVTNSGGTATFLAFSSAGSDGTRMIVGEYATGAAGAGWENSKKVWATQDAGVTWQVVYDAQVLYPADFDDSHIHGCAYDPWQGVYLVVEGHTAQMGIRWSADPFTDPTDWTRIEAGPLGSVRTEGQPTCIVPTEAGIVCASDAPEQGIWVVQRGATPADMQVHWLYEWPAGRGGTLGYGQCYAVDPRSGVVYLGYRHNHVPDSLNPLAIFASDGKTGGVVWQGDLSTVPGAGQGNDIIRLAVTPWGTIEAQTSSTSMVGNKKIVGRVALGVGLTFSADPGGVLGGSREGTAGAERAVAVGTGALASEHLTVAVGNGASASAASSTAVGAKSKASAANTVALGSESASSGSNAIAIGYGIKAGVSCLVIGASRDLSARNGVVSLGAVQTVTQDSVVAIGQSVTVSGAGATAIGASAQATSTFAIAIGNSAVADQAYSIALGNGSNTSGAYQVAFGARYLALMTPTSAPPAGADEARLFTDLDGGTGKRRLRVQFPSGAPITIATEV